MSEQSVGACGQAGAGLALACGGGASGVVRWVWKCALGECVRSERASGRAKAVGLLWGARVAECVGAKGERGRWFAFIRTWGERILSIILSGAVLL